MMLARRHSLIQLKYKNHLDGGSFGSSGVLMTICCTLCNIGLSVDGPDYSCQDTLCMMHACMNHRAVAGMQVRVFVKVDGRLAT